MIPPLDVAVVVEVGLPQERHLGGFVDSRRQTDVTCRGADKLWAFKSSLEIQLVHVAGVRADPEAARGWWHGVRMPGTNVPGVITAGTFYQDGRRVFWDVHHPEKTIVIDLHDERFNQLMVEVAEPDAAVKLIQNAL